jgi:hypothetical protein
MATRRAASVLTGNEELSDQFVAVDPFLTDEGDLSCLVEELGIGKAQPVPRSERMALNMRWYEGQISLELAAKVSSGGIFSGNLDISDRAYLMEALLSSDVYRKEATGQPIVATRYGIGLRIMLRVTGLKTDMSLEVGNIGAAVQLGLASATYQILQYGLNAFPSLSDALAGLAGGQLDAQIFAALEESVRKSVAAQIKAGRETLPQATLPIAVLLNSPAVVDEMLVARSVLYAVQGINQGHPLERVCDYGAAYDIRTIERVWFDMVGDVLPGDPPGKDARQRAASWLSGLI